MDKAPTFERRGHAEVRTSNHWAVASCQALVSIVRASTGTWFKWIRLSGLSQWVFDETRISEQVCVDASENASV